MTAHGITCGSPPCPYLKDESCRRAKPTGFQPDLRRKEYWSMWPAVNPDADYCGEHPSLRDFLRFPRLPEGIKVLRTGLLPDVWEEDQS